MADIAKKKEPRPDVLPAREPLGFEPYRVLRDLLRWDPFAPFANQDMHLQPSFDLAENDASYVLKMDVPGVREADLNVSLHGSRLIVSGKREGAKEEKGGAFHRTERWSGAFSRTITLPEDAKADAIEANLVDGVLTITLPKAGETTTKRIAIKGSTDKSAQG